MNRFTHFICDFLLTPFTALLQAWTFSLLWLWFVVPVFGHVALSLPAAYGLVLIGRFLTYHIPNTLLRRALKEEETDEMRLKDFQTNILKALMVSGQFLFWGYIAHLLMAY